ncbi:ABC transporter ATP-binding protein [Blautia liquoris]|uniref:ABC transporter ATP-binding protein n=1 Tax=Blautia liquoris TaxID=2779518 RepID=A0A7M2RGX9_9FIRM|nr:ABC transporter ATP-binding protein [Blautia liquoris]QOV19586.1 ABC transporter ATP-binding protein [Blautia liquoris]
MKKTNKVGSTWKRILSLIKPYRMYVILMLVMAFLTVASTLYAPILIGEGVDMIVGPGRVNGKGLLSLVLTFLIVIAITSVSQWIMSLATNHITFQVVQDVRDDAFRKMEILPIRYIDNHQPGDAISRITTDVEQFSDGLLMGFTQFFTGVITIFGTIGFMVSIHPGITLLVVCITPLSFFVAGFIAKRTYDLFRIQSEARSDMTSLVEEMVGNQQVVKAFSYEGRAKERFGVINERLRITGIKSVFFSSLTNPSTRFINSLVYTGVCIYGAFMAISGGISVGQLTSFMAYANQYTKPFNEISGVVTELQNALACAKRIFDFIDEKPETPDDAAAVDMKHGKGSVALSHVNFSYIPEKPLIKDVSLEAKPGQRIAIVGPTGCGKTTVINLLMRFYDIDSGSLQIDGHEIRHLTRDSLRENFGMVLQDTWLKNGTIAENIAYGKPDASMKEIETAAKKALAHSFIMRMPDKYHTVISEDGGNISQGQKQLLCIARVMLMKPPILILDEATSSIDTRTELKVQEAFQNLMEGRTSFVVAHRLSTIREADVILVMKDGEIIEKGKHQELLSRGGFYAKLYQSQFAKS